MLSGLRKVLAFGMVGALVLALAGMTLAQPTGFAGPQLLPARDELAVVQVAVPGEGGMAFFVLRQSARFDLSEQTGIFQLMGPEAVGESMDVAVRARVEVLSPDPATGAPRVRVQAQPLDPETLAALTSRIWDAVYVFDGREALLVEGEEPTTEEYRLMVNPRWLANWVSVALEDLPGPVLKPGDRWQSSMVDPTLESLGIPGGQLPVTGEFVGWVDLPAVSGGRVALVAESLNTGLTSFRDEVDESFAFDVEYNIVGESQSFVVPSDFPYMIIGSMEADFLMRTAEASGEDFAGSMRMRVSYSQSIEREFDGAFAAWSQPNLPILEIGGTVTGFLGEGSADYGDGSYADVYVLYGNAGDEIAIRMSSQEFDAYLEVQDDTFNVIAWDDDTDGSTDAELYIRLPYTGPYYVVANAYFPQTGGNYILTVTREPVPEAPDTFDLTDLSEEDLAALIERTRTLLPLLQTPAVMTDQEVVELEDALWTLLTVLWQEQDARSGR